MPCNKLRQHSGVFIFFLFLYFAENDPDRPFTCDVCHASYRRKGFLEAHKKRAHLGYVSRVYWGYASCRRKGFVETYKKRTYLEYVSLV